ncbi:MAG: hypothetical protein HC871_15335 [Rhizobiales bacterium]|nr:hypothetical protein [Hyphomicrobiales bacterium]
MIGRLIRGCWNRRLTAVAKQAFRHHIRACRLQSRCADARSIRHALDRARLRHVIRRVDREEGPLTPDQLMTIESEEILKSRIISSSEAPKDRP